VNSTTVHVRPVRLAHAFLAIGLAATLVFGSATAASAQDSAPIVGGGSSFAQLEFDQWRADVARPPHNLTVSYSAAGSTDGRNNFSSEEFDFATTDIEYPSSEPTPARPFVYLPVSAGGLGFMYNLIGYDGVRITNLRLSQVNLCRAFTEPGIRWNDPAIAAENPGARLPSNLVKRVVRADGSGTSHVLSEFCIATAPAVWEAFRASLQFDQNTSPEFRAGLPTSNWPRGYSQVSNAFAADGVANVVANDIVGRNAITYTGPGHARERGFPNASIQNPAGEYLAPTAAAVTAGLSHATPRPNGTITPNPLSSDPAAYFPALYSYVLAPTTGFDPAEGSTLARFLNYAVTDGQDRAVPLGYARLPAVLVSLALDQIAKIPGAPARPPDPELPPPAIPEVPMVILLPLIVVLVIGFGRTRLSRT
jgi:ABC-type phosphate transport system substrate-binding protein